MTVTPPPFPTDPSAAEAVQDDADEWEPIVLPPPPLPEEDPASCPKNAQASGVAANDTSTAATTFTSHCDKDDSARFPAQPPQQEQQEQQQQEQQEKEQQEQHEKEDQQTWNEMLRAVDALLAADETTAGSASSRSTPTETSTTRPSASTPTPPLTHQRYPRQSPLQLRRRLRAARRKLHDVTWHPVARYTVQTTRKVVTGSHHTRVRDYVVRPAVTRRLDKYLFTGGVLGMLGTEYLVLQRPAWFRYFFVATLLPLMVLRVVLFRRTKQHYFLLDYCYWVNGLGVVLALVPPRWGANDQNENDWYDIGWQIFFVSANGPLFFAMVAWNNSLVFHSIDKSTSTAIHLLPALLSYCERWRADYCMNDDKDTSNDENANSLLTWTRHLGYPLLFYATWQTVYLLQTEWWHKDALDSDPELSTSLRYLTTAEKMSIHKQTLKLCRSLRLLRPTETFSPPTFKVKFIFVVLQALMTLVTFLPVGLFYHYQAIHTVVVLAILTYSVYNGARYYIQVFSRIYEKRYQTRAGDPPTLAATLEEEEYVDTGSREQVTTVNHKKDT